jgi:hypothetical protein
MIPNCFKIFIFIALFFPLLVFAQESIKPGVLQNVRSERIRDLKLEAAVRSNHLFGYDEEKEGRYYYNRIDLNGDKRPEVLVFLFGRTMCGSSVFSALLFQKISDEYKSVTAFDPARNPIIVSESKTNGWRDLIFYNSGDGIIPGYYSISRFDGQSYPGNPTVEQDVPPVKTKITGTAFVVGDFSPNLGLRFRRRK